MIRMAVACGRVFLFDANPCYKNGKDLGAGQLRAEGVVVLDLQLV